MSFPKCRWRVSWYLLVMEQGVVSIELWSAVLKLVGSFKSWNAKWTFLALRMGWKRENWVPPNEIGPRDGYQLHLMGLYNKEIAHRSELHKPFRFPWRTLTLLALRRWLLSLWNILPTANAFVYLGLGQALSDFPEGDPVLLRKIIYSFHREMVN